jgi:thioesterase domain-containing protein
MHNRDVAKAVALIVAEYKRNPKQPVILFGHSWGGGSAIETAFALNKLGIPVQLLITFDAVGRGAMFGSGTLYLPPNVQQAINYQHTVAETNFLGNNDLVGLDDGTAIANVPIRGSSHTSIDNDMGNAVAQVISDFTLQNFADEARRQQQEQQMLQLFIDLIYFPPI